MTFVPLRLEPLNCSQLPAVVELDRLCLGGLWSLEGYQRELESPNSQLLALSWNHPEDPSIIGLGCFWAILEEAHITILVIHPDFQGQSLGNLLLYYLLREAAQWGLERATLEVNVSNHRALSLYQKFGFNIAGRRKGYYPNGDDALILWRNGLNREEFQQQLIVWDQKISDRLTQNQWQFNLGIPYP